MLEWLGTLILLGLLFLLVPIFFMLIITLQFWLTERERPRTEPVAPTHSFGEEGKEL